MARLLRKTRGLWRTLALGLAASLVVALATSSASSDDIGAAAEAAGAAPVEAPQAAPSDAQLDESAAPQSESAARKAARALGRALKPPVAENVDLSSPLYEAPPEPPLSRAVPDVSSRPDDALDDLTAAQVEPLDESAGVPLILLGETVQPGTAARLSWSLDQRFEGIAVATPVLVVNGTAAGPTLCLTAAVHGDELNGIEIVRRVLYDLEPDDLFGTVIGVPIVNLPSFRRGSRYLPDRRDLNRYFPGSATGSAASRIAHSFFNEVISACDALVDIHTGSLHRANLPQLRADMRAPSVAALTEKFSATAVLHSGGAEGTLRRAAVEAGIPAVTLETGEPYRLDEEDIAHGTVGIQSLLEQLGMQRRVSIWGAREPVYYQSTWVRADRGGLLFGQVELGQKVKEGQVLGVVSDPITNLRSELHAPRAGRVLGMALNQVVMPGFAAFRIGIPTTESDLAEPDSSEAPFPTPADPVTDEDDEHS